MLTPVLVLLFVSPLAAQQPEAKTMSPATPPVASSPAEPKLMFEREVFSYPSAAGRRDPFRKLSREDAGPLFQDLKLTMIIFVPAAPGRSMAAITDAGKKMYRVRRGDVIGNATVLDVGPRRVLFSVEDFGMRRQEVLELKPTRKEGA